MKDLLSLATLFIYYAAANIVEGQSIHTTDQSGFEKASSAPQTSQNIAKLIGMGQMQSRGVNLGGWFVGEHWMTPNSSIYNGLAEDERDQGEYTAAKALSRKEKQDSFHHHWSTFITEQDIAEIAASGLNTVRVSVGYWIAGFDMHDSNNSKEWEVYATGGLAYLDRLIRKWALRHNIAVLISLHAAKGSQNKAEHSSPPMLNQALWAKFPENVDSTLDAVVRLAKRYRYDQAFLGISLLNEPSDDVPTDVLYEYYRRSYKAIREDENIDCVIVLAPLLSNQSDTNTLYEVGLDDKQDSKLWVDWHRYFVWGYESKSSLRILAHEVTRFQEDAKRWKQNENGGKKLVVGEFSLASPEGKISGNEMLRVFAARQLAVLTTAVDGGWMFWSWKLEGDLNSSDELQPWSLRSLLRGGAWPRLL